MAQSAGDPWAPFVSRLAASLDGGDEDVWDRRTGSLLKLDITGFTTLTERLARAARTGAEELNDVLTDAFTGLVDAVAVHDGDVLQYGGDAIAVWFDGLEHRGRALEASAAAHAWMRAQPAVSTPAGSVRLRASAGIASGEVLFGVVGRDHRDLVALGPVVTALIAAEAAAAPGRTVVAPWQEASAAQSSERRRTRRRSGRWAVPAAVRTLLRDGMLPGEHRRAAAAFVGVRGFDQLVTQGRDQDVADRVGRLVTSVEQVCSATGVTWSAADLTADGLVLLLYAGAPLATEHDAARMLHAAQMLIEREPDVRVGAHVGRVFAGVLGAPSRHCWTALGDTTNTAARLMGRAEPGTAVVSDEMVQAAGVTIAGERESLTLKGKRSALVALRVLPGTPLGLDDRPEAAAPLVGRDAELGRLVQALESATQRHRTSTLLLGAAGMGKSRLVGEALAQRRLAGAHLIRTRATPFDTASAYAAFRGPVRDLLGTDPQQWAERAGSDRDLVPLLGLPAGIDVPPTAATQALAPELVPAVRDRLLARMLLEAADGPVVLVVEDTHWLDRGSLGLLDALAATPPDQPLALVVEMRDPPGTGTSPTGWPAEPARWDVVELAPLADGDLRRLARTASPDRPLDDLQLDALVREAGGNPLFAQELARFAAGGTGDAHGAVPDSLDAVVAARIDRLPAGPRLVLRETAVAGEGPLAVVADALERPELAESRGWRTLREFVAVAPDDRGEVRVRFRSDVYRRGAYDGLSLRRRRDLHATLADLLDGRDEDPAVVAVHAEAAGQHARAATLARTAGEAADRAGAWGDALRSWERAWTSGLRAGLPDRRLATVAERRAHAADLAGRYEVAEKSLREALRRDPDAPASTRTRRAVALAAAVERQGRYRSALRLLTLAERDLLLGERDPGWPAVALRRSSVLYRCGRLRDSLVLAARVEQRPGTSRADRARALLREEMCASELGLPERAELGERALRAFRGVRAERDLASLLGNLGVTAWETDDWSLALVRYRESEAAYRRAGDLVGAAIATNNAAEVLCEQGHDEPAVEMFEDARRTFRASGHAFAAACTLSSLGRLAARAGDWARATDLLSEAESEFRRMASPVFLADCLVRQAELALLHGDPAAGERVAAAARAVDDVDADRALRTTVARYTALSAATQGAVEDACRQLRDALQAAESARALHEEVLCLHALVELGCGGEETSAWMARRDTGAERLGLVRLPVLPPRITGDF